VVQLKLSEGKQYVEKDGRRVGGEYEAVLNLNYTPDGEPVFAAKSGRAWQVLRGGKPLGDRYDYVGNMAVSPTGAVAFAGRLGDRYRVVLDGSPWDMEFDQITGLIFSPDGQSLAVTASENGKALVLRDGVRQPLDIAWVSRPRFSADGTSLFYVGGDENGSRVFKDGRPISSTYLSINFWVVSPDGAFLAMWVARPTGYCVVKDDVVISHEYPYRESIRNLVFGPDGQTVYYIALPMVVPEEEDVEGLHPAPGWQIYKDTVAVGPLIEADSVSDLVFSPDGQSVAFVMRRENRWFVGRNGQAISSGFDQITNLRNSPDGKSLLFSGRSGQGVSEVAIPW
jgi:WD40 repeat protein